MRIKSVFLILCLLLSVAADAKSPLRRGYIFGLETRTAVSVDKSAYNQNLGLNTLHGFSFGNGAYVGGGVGVNLKKGFLGGIYIPVLLNAKYNFTKSGALLPFAEMRTNVSFKIDDYFEVGKQDRNVFGVSIEPALGVDMASFSVKFGCSLSSLSARIDNATATVRENYLFVSMGVNF